MDGESEEQIVSDRTRHQFVTKTKHFSTVFEDAESGKAR
jgi:hypothetical protein